MRKTLEKVRSGSGYKWWILGMVMLTTFMAVMDVTVVNVGLPTIMSSFHVGISSAEWVITAYMITMTIMLPSSGWLADRFGNKKFFILGIALFTLGSFLCGRASNDAFLIASRALQGIGSGIIQSLGLAIVTREFPPKQLGVALGFWAVAAAASISLGPLVGGYLVDDFNWHLIFDINVPIGILVILLSLFLQKEWKSEVKGKFDWPGFISIAVFMPATVYALAHGNSPNNPAGWSSPVVIGCFAVAAVTLAVFIVTELRSKDPLLNIRLLGNLNFGIGILVLFLFGIGLIGGTYLLPLYMQRGLDYTAIMAGSVFLPVGVIQGTLSAVSGFLTRRIPPLGLVFAGIFFMTLSFFLASLFTAHTTHSEIIGVLLIRGFGIGLTFAPLNLFSLKYLELKDMAAASGISNSIKQLSGSIGIALLTVIMTSRTEFHAQAEHASGARVYIEGITDDFLIVTFITLAGMLPFLLLLVRKKKSGPKAGTGESDAVISADKGSTH